MENKLPNSKGRSYATRPGAEGISAVAKNISLGDRQRDYHTQDFTGNNNNHTVRYFPPQSVATTRLLQKATSLS